MSEREESTLQIKTNSSYINNEETKPENKSICQQNIYKELSNLKKKIHFTTNFKWPTAFKNSNLLAKVYINK